MVLVGGTVVFIAILLFVRALSTVWMLIRLYDYTLVRDGDDLRAEYGLFTRVTATIPVRRVQTISIHQRFLHRRLNRAAIRVTTAGGGSDPTDEKSGEREWLAPIVRLDQVRGLIQQIDGTLETDDISWRPAHPRAFRRVLRVSSIWAGAITAVSAVFIGWWALAVAAVLGIRAVARSRGYIRSLGAALVGDRVAFRSGWFHRVTTVVRFERIQSVALFQSLFDRRTDMAVVSVDTAGMGAGDLEMPYFPRAEAAALHAALARAAIRTPFTW
jgi:putative membrane protein